MFLNNQLATVFICFVIELTAAARSLQFSESIGTAFLKGNKQELSTVFVFTAALIKPVQIKNTSEATSKNYKVVFIFYLCFPIVLYIYGYIISVGQH